MSNSPEKYYYLVAGLPEIDINSTKLGFDIDSLKDEVFELLNSNDIELLKFVLFRYDLQNIIALYIEEKEDFWDSNAYFSKEELDNYFSSKVTDFPENIETAEQLLALLASHYKTEFPIYEGLSWENQFALKYYSIVSELNNKFLKGFYSFEMNLKNIIIAINSGKFNLETPKYLVGNSDVVEAILGNKSRDFGLGGEYPFLNKIIPLFDDSNFSRREKELDVVKIEMLDELLDSSYFTIDNIFAFLIKYEIVSRWATKSEEEGRKALDAVFNELENSYELPEKFNLSNAKR